MMASGEMIRRERPEDTLIVFDEIQEYPNALNTLKYFYENTPPISCRLRGLSLGHRVFQAGFLPRRKGGFFRDRANDLYGVSDGQRRRKLRQLYGQHRENRAYAAVRLLLGTGPGCGTDTAGIVQYLGRIRTRLC